MTKTKVVKEAIWLNSLTIDLGLKKSYKVI